MAAGFVDRQSDILQGISAGVVPSTVRTRLNQTRTGTLPWMATLSAAELLLARRHGFRPIATVTATCWMHYAWSWTKGHSEGWMTALRRLKDEARELGANAILDVKLRTLPLPVEQSMDFSLVGTAVRIEGLSESGDAAVATVPVLEFLRLLEADVVPTGIAVGAHYEWFRDSARSTQLTFCGNIESEPLSGLWEQVRREAHQELRAHARPQGNGVLAHVNFSQILESEREGDSAKWYLARHIVVATTVQTGRRLPMPEVHAALDLHALATPLKRHRPHHQSYETHEKEGAI